jgi:hypothetical protein
MEKINRQFLESLKFKLPKEKSLSINSVYKVKVNSLAFPIGILVFLVLWIILCYNSNFFLKEALICSSVVAGLLFLSYQDQNGDSRKSIK